MENNSVKMSIVILLSMYAVLLPGCSSDQYGDIYADDAHRLINSESSNNGIVIIDCRSESDFMKGHIENALNIDICNEKFLMKYEDLGKEHTYLFYCQSGLKSSIVHDYLKKRGFHKIFNMTGGIKQWIHRGYPVVVKNRINNNKGGKND